jgi:hypothetical protein
MKQPASPFGKETMRYILSVKSSSGFPWIAAGLLVASFAGGPARAADPGVEFFEKKIRPVLAQHCCGCHSAAKKHKGGLALDSREAVRKGGDSGPALVPGQPERSRLIRAVRYADETLQMPPKGKLPDAVIADLENWVKMGAPDPRDTAASAPADAWGEVLRERRRWWSLQPVRPVEPPPVRQAGWSDHPVDRFILARLEKAGLEPAGPADRRTLLRRASLVLTGLPPTAAEIAAFLRDDSPGAYEKAIDRLLASPHFGERWARHWLDVVRYAETHGNEWNYEVHHAWRYRDYLIRAFNDDVPYDQFVREHVAGDLLPRPRWNRIDKFNESVIGTAFWRFGEVNHDDCIEFRQIGFDLADNQIDTLSKAFQGLTIACARCHDHKLDAVSMQDYYALLGILRSSRQVSHTIDAPEVNDSLKRRLRALKTSIRRDLAEVWLREAGEVGKYLLAAQAARDKRADAAALARGLDPERLGQWAAALAADKPALEDLLYPWKAMHSPAAKDAAAYAAAWHALAQRYSREEKSRADFNARGFVSFGDFRAGRTEGWQAAGQGLDATPARSGDFAVACEGDAAVTAVFPAGFATHALSERLNGTLRSPQLPADKKHISLRVFGGRTAAARLVSNNCQLNYKNYRVLKSPEPGWLTLAVPDDADGLRVYAELMTKLDNPKFPDQLGRLGGDDRNMQVRWEEAAADPRSFFGATRVVLHDGPEPPRDELSHLRPLFAGPEPMTDDDLAARCGAAAAAAVRAWAEDRASDDDVRWLDGLLRCGLLGNAARATPRLGALVNQYRDTEKRLSLPRIVPGLADFDAGFEQPVLVRGDCRKPGEVVRRRYIEVLSRPGVPFRPHGSGRLDLAERIASADNPLTARVLVNRVWHHLFGTGIVRTPDDFGHVGEPPSHPELLDYLAARFVAEGWSVKRLVRFLVLSKTFRMSNRLSTAGKGIDPQDRLLHHYPARRMEAEAIRDSILAVSGRLDPRLYGPSVQPYRDKPNPDRRLFPGPLDGNGRRSVYIKANLMEGPGFLSVFNFPGGKVARGRRDATNVPAQALALLNDPFVVQQAGFWADRLVSRPAPSVSARLEEMFQAALGRGPTGAERQRFAQAVADFAALHGVAADGILQSREVWKDVAHTLFNLQEFLYIP